MKVVLLIVCGLVMTFSSLAYEAGMTKETPTAQTGSQQEAQRLWEQAVAAKGGRERLHAVRNMIVSWGENGHVHLHVFPDKIWRWMDDRSSPIGLSVDMHNLGRGLAYLSYPDDPESPRRLGSPESGGVPLRDTQLYYLLETQWVKPSPIGLTKGRAGGRAANVVQTLVGGKRVDFYLDRETHLPLRVSFPVEGGGPGTYFVDFSDYATIDGIQLPRRVSYIDGGWIPTRYQLNVAYDESIFERPPTIKAGPDAWKPKP